jgi:hypothetical protein
MQTHEDQPPIDQNPAAAGEPEPPADKPAAGVGVGSHRKRPGAMRDAPPAGQPPSDAPLALPRGALIAMRRSGGMRFSSHELVVYRSGKLTYRQSAPELVEQTQHLSLSQLVELHHALKQSRLTRLPATIGRHSPDTFAYEIVARVGRVVKAVEVFEGSIPAELAPLIRELRSLTPQDEA